MKKIRSDRRRIRAITLMIATCACLVSGAFTSAAHAAKEVKFKEFPFEIVKGDRLVINGVRGSVKLIALASGKAPVVRARKVLPDGAKSTAPARFEAMSFAVRKEGTVVTIEPKGYESRQDFIEGSQVGQPDMSFEIEAPSTSAEIHYHSGVVIATGWKDSIGISLVDGRITSTDGEGALRASITRGEVKIEKHKGSVAIENHGGKVTVGNVAGDVRVHSFAGETSIANIEGRVDFRAKAGILNLNKIDGGVGFDNGRGTLNGQALEGPIRGSTDDGSVNFQLAGEPDLVIDTEDGTVTVKAPGGTGALLKLSTDEGAIVAPDSVRVPKVSGAKNVVARLDGAPKGTIVVRSKRGTIRIR